MQDSNPYKAPATENLSAEPLGKNSNSEPSDESEFVLSGCLTVADAIAAHRLGIRGVWLKLVLALTVIIASILVFVAIGISTRPHAPRSANIILVVAGAISPGLLLTFIGIKRYRLHQSARQQLGMFAPTYTSFSTVRIISISNSAKSKLEWPFFSHYRANDTVVLLFVKDSAARVILARSKLQPPATWDGLLALVRSKLTMS